MPTGKTRATAVAVRMRWWAVGGEEACPHCGQLYAYEVEFRCPDCDEPCCPQCTATRADKSRSCPNCVDELAEDLSRG